MKNIIKKIPILEIIEILEELYEMGYDYMDVEGVVGDDQDSLKIYTSLEYLCKKEELTEEDLNNLI